MKKVVFTYENDKFDPNCVQPFFKMYGNRIRFSPGIKPMVTLKVNSKDEDEILKEVKEFLSK